jgi:hypothetical protein
MRFIRSSERTIPPRCRHAAADVAEARAARRDRNAMGRGKSQQARDRGGAAGQGDGLGQMAGEPFVAGVFSSTAGSSRNSPAGRSRLSCLSERGASRLGGSLRCQQSAGAFGLVFRNLDLNAADG